ncbi:hypothetical protein [Candidatus Nitrospira nitrosa]|nr:hypothetical protein [Candidatus Nitrospira nitrosa]
MADRSLSYWFPIKESTTAIGIASSMAPMEGQSGAVYLASLGLL